LIGFSRAAITWRDPLCNFPLFLPRMCPKSGHGMVYLGRHTWDAIMWDAIIWDAILGTPYLGRHTWDAIMWDAILGTP
jgi:hypothetical protein